MDNVETAPDDELQLVLTQIGQDADVALAHMDDLLRRYGGDARLHFLRGSVLASSERYHEARAAMQRAIEVSPGYALARFQLGLLELTLGEAAAAETTLLPLLDLPAENPLSRFAGGLFKMLLGELEAAIALLEEGMALNTELPPMNKDMSLMVSEIRARLEAQPKTEPAEATAEVESDAHFLLKQYSFKDTRH